MSRGFPGRFWALLDRLQAGNRIAGPRSESPVQGHPGEETVPMEKTLGGGPLRPTFRSSSPSR